MDEDFKFGLSNLIYLNKALNNSDNTSGVVHIKKLTPFLSNNEIITRFKEACTANVENINDIESLCVFIHSESFLLELQQLYTVGTGILSIQPSEVLSMTPREIELAYCGFLQKTELQIKCLQTVLKQAIFNDFKPIKLLDDEIQQSTQEKREKTFDILNI